MPDYGTIQDLARYRLEKAHGLLQTAAALIEMGDAASAVNRQYYAVYNAIRAVFALTQTAFKKHSGAISYFQMKYIKTGVFPDSMSVTLVNLFRMRNEADYGDFEDVNIEDALKYQVIATQFVKKVADYLADKL